MQAEGAVGGFVVTSGHFTKDAEDFAHGRGIELVPAERFLGEVRSHARHL
jgi:restriction system protein